MFTQPLPGPQPSLFAVQCASRNNTTDGNASSGSWETNYSAEDLRLIAPLDFSAKGAGVEAGSPMSHIYGLDRSSSLPYAANALGGMASLTLEDSHAIMQAAVAEQQAMGWGGRPLQQHGSMQQQHPQQMRMALADYSPSHMGGASHQNQGHGHQSVRYQQHQHHNNHQHQQQQQGHHHGQRNGSRNGHNQQPNSGQNRNNNNRGGNMNGGAGGNNNHNKNNNGGNNNNRNLSRANSGPLVADARAGPKGQSYRRLWQQVTCVNRGGHLTGEGACRETTVEDLLEVVRHLPPEASAVKAVSQGLYFLDSGALAALLKELNKAGHARRSQEIFDWLRTLEPANDLYGLCNTMTYTTMISQCGSQQALRRALELVAEMRGRGVQCNVHTYSALMNVCIKANELDLALDVYRQMQSEGCTPNLVTYNTLIDVYGKTGAWEEAVAVLDALEAGGIEPEVRTYNTVIIACNQSSRAAEALRVYERMLAAGAQPTATTYTALISAYGKAGQLDAALQIFQDMVQRGCERNVITYSSLISACEKAGRWELALQLFEEMHIEGCRPNVVTFNSLIAACAQGAQWERAQALFEQMQAKGCRPDSVTFGGLIAAYDRAGHWRRALAAFEQMRGLNCRPDTVVYNTVVGALWKTGLVWAQARATQIFHAACRQGHFRMTVHTQASSTEGSTIGVNGGGGGCMLGSPTSSGTLDAAVLHRMGSGLADELFGDMTPPASASDCGGSSLAASCRSPSPTAGTATAGSSAPPSPLPVGAAAAASIEFGMHAFTVGSATLSLLRWVGELRDRLPRDTIRVDPGQSVSLLLNKGKPSRDHTYPAIRSALCAMLRAWQAPLDLTDVPQGCRVEGATADVVEWLRSPQVDRALSAFSARSESPRGIQRDAFFHEDSMVESRCAEAFAAVQKFEAAYHAPAGEGQGQGREWFKAAASLAGSLGYSDEVLYDGFLLADRARACAGDEGLGASTDVVLAACLEIAVQQAGECSAQLSPSTDLNSDKVFTAGAQVRTLLGGDTSSISALRVLKLFLERLGGEFGGADQLWPVAGTALDLLPNAVCDSDLRKEHPSLVAAATLLAGRRAAGHSPFWPMALAALTGLDDGEGSTLSKAAEQAATLGMFPHQ